MTVINLDQSYKTVCKYCGLVKQSLVPGNFVCKDCKKFCEQQLSGEELDKRDREVFNLVVENRNVLFSLSITEFISSIDLKLYNGINISNQQYLSVCRILKKGK
jgi:hypothetical protein